MSRMFGPRARDSGLGEMLAAREEEIRAAFNLLSKDDTAMPTSALKGALQMLGLDVSREDISRLLKKADPTNSGSIDYSAFYALMADPTRRRREFCEEIVTIFEECREFRGGANANYIPFLELVDSELYGISICTVDGQRFSYGDAAVDFCMQSCIKPLTYCLACEERGIELVHEHVGYEPSGVAFNAFSLNYCNRPHNPMINSGAITVCALMQPEASPAVRFATLCESLKAMSGGARIGFNQAVFLSEKETADKNFALAYYMRSHGVFPPGTRLQDFLDFYFQCCSIECNCESMSVMAATLANAGVCPTTGRRCIAPKTVRNCLALMYSCGLYDYSGEWAFTVGLPAKSGVSGALFVVVPNVMGLALYSPPLDRRGNSVRAVEFCKRLTERFSFSIFDQLVLGVSTKVDPTASPNSSSYFKGPPPPAGPDGAAARRPSAAGPAPARGGPEEECAAGGLAGLALEVPPAGEAPERRAVTFAAPARRGEAPAPDGPPSPGPVSAARLSSVLQRLSHAAAPAPAAPPGPTGSPGPSGPPAAGGAGGGAAAATVYTSFSPRAGASSGPRGGGGPSPHLTRVSPVPGEAGSLVSDLADSSPAFSRYKNAAMGFRS